MIYILTYILCVLMGTYGFQKVGKFPLTTSKLAAELKLLIQGTTNAYTTVRTGDIVSYKLSSELESDEDMTDIFSISGSDVATKGLGLFTNEGEVLPLCVRDKFRDEYYIDHTRAPLRVSALQNEGRLLRMISANRIPDKNAYRVDEWIDQSYYVPIVSSDEVHRFEEASKSKSKFESTKEEKKSVVNDHDEDIAEIEAKLKVAKLELQLLQLKQRQSRSGEE